MKEYAPICSNAETAHRANQAIMMVLDGRPAIRSVNSFILTVAHANVIKDKRAATVAVVMDKPKNLQNKAVVHAEEPLFNFAIYRDMRKARPQIARMLIAKAMKASSWIAGTVLSREKAKIAFKSIVVSVRTRLDPARVQATAAS
jgi:hypothetical protein